MGRATFPPDSVAYRRTLIAGAAAFVGGFVLVAALSVFCLVRYAIPQGHWAAIVHCVLYTLMLPFFGGGAAAAAVMAGLDRWHHWRGVYKCVSCGRPLRRGLSPCVCWSDPAHPMAAIYARMRKRHHPPRLRHYRRRLGPVLATYAALVPVSVAFVALSPRRHPNGFLADLVVGHFLLCGLLGVMISVAISTLELLGRGRRFRLRTEAFLRIFALWPAIAAFAWAGVALLR
jgi:hypothetical protein